MKGIPCFDWLPEQTKCFYHPCSGHPLCPANGVVEHNITFHGDFPSRRSNDLRKSRKNSCLSNESANFNGFEKKPPKLVPQANPKAAFNFRRWEGSCCHSFKRSVNSETVSALYFHFSRKHKMNDYS